MDKLKELQEEAKSDLAIISLEHLDQESYKNQLIKPKWLEYKTGLVDENLRKTYGGKLALLDQVGHRMTLGGH